MKRTPFAWVALFVFGACAPDGKKTRQDCDADADCQGGVCFNEQCYTACTTRDGCAEDEVCVWKDDADGNLSICVVAAEQIGCTGDADCLEVVRLGACEQAVCAPSGVCDATRLPECGVTTFSTCNAPDGDVQVTEGDPADLAGLPFGVGDLPSVGVLASEDPVAGVTRLYVWMRSAGAPDAEDEGHALTVKATLSPTDAGEGIARPSGQALVRRAGTVGLDAEYLLVDEKRSSLTWRASSPRAGEPLTAALDLRLRTRCGSAAREVRIAANVATTILSADDLAESRAGCEPLLAAALASPLLQRGRVDLTLDGESVPFGELSEVSAVMDVDSGTLLISAMTPNSLQFVLDDRTPVAGAHEATVILHAVSAECMWQALGSATVSAPSPGLDSGPLTGTVAGSLLLLGASAPTCAPATRDVSASFTAALCWYWLD